MQYNNINEKNKNQSYKTPSKLSAEENTSFLSSPARKPKSILKPTKHSKNSFYSF